MPDKTIYRACIVWGDGTAETLEHQGTRAELIDRVHDVIKWEGSKGPVLVTLGNQDAIDIWRADGYSRLAGGGFVHIHDEGWENAI